MESDNTIIRKDTSQPDKSYVTDDWRKAMLSVETVYADAPVVLRVNGVRAGTLGNFSASIGKAKSKKSFNVTAMAAAALCSDYVLGYDVILPSDRSTILYVDTEQSCGDCQLLMRRILALAGHSPDADSPKLVFLSLRQYTPAERVAILEEAMASLPTVGFVIIDGVRDLLHDINNPTEATSVISLMMKWTDRYQFHLHTVLHQNKSDDNARRHLGTELANKAETVMSIEKDKEDGAVSVVRPVYTRSTEFPPFAFRIGGGELALPEIVGDYSFTEPTVGRPGKGKFSPFDLGEENHRRGLSKIFPDQTETYTYSELSKEIKSAYGEVLGHPVGDNAVSKIIQFLRNKRMIVQDDNRNSMVGNLLQEKAEKEAALAELHRQILAGHDNPDALRLQVRQLEQELSTIQVKLDDKQEKLSEADRKLDALREEMTAIQERTEELRQKAYKYSGTIQKGADSLLKNALLENMVSEFSERVAQLSEEGKNVFDGSLLQVFAENGTEVMYCATLLFLGYVDDATTFAEGHGGGGSSSGLKWGRDDDEDERAWARRCMMKAARMMVSLFRQKEETVSGTSHITCYSIHRIKLNNMRKILILFLGFALSLGTQAKDCHRMADTTTVIRRLAADEMLRPLKPSYMKGALVASPWTDNWFIQAAGGTTVFLGTPLGCNDLFGRMKPAFSVSLGKWFTPFVGGRLNYGGIQFNDCDNQSQDCQYLRADFMWNVLGNIYEDDVHSFARWSVIPYVGIGMLHNKDNGHKPFAISYGIQGQYHLSRRIAVTAEIGNMTTMQDFDGYGKSHRLGDHLLSASLGLSVRIGKSGWKRVIDAHPYIAQNAWLSAYAASLSDSNSRYHAQHDRDRQTLEQLRKIFAIEGLLDKYSHLFPDDTASIAANGYPRNDYSGLNSLRARMRDRNGNGHNPKVTESTPYTEESGNGTEESDGNYLSLIQTGKTCIGAPVYFFFELESDRLLNKSQLVNLDEVARIAKKYGLIVKVVGAADSATGSEAINDNLSRSRAVYIAQELEKRGMENGTVAKGYDGGIDDYSPNEANRHTRIMLYFRQESEKMKSKEQEHQNFFHR